MITIISIHDLWLLMQATEVESIKFYVDGRFVDSIEFVEEGYSGYVLYGTGDAKYKDADYEGCEIRFSVAL